jgi:magnesium-transporting ATPase (P-type)
VVTYIKESSVGELIGDTFRIYAKNLLPLFLICLLPMAPFEILKAIGVAAGSQALVGIAALLSAAASVFVYGAVTVAVSDICLGNPPTLKRSYSAIGRVLGKYLVAYLLIVVIIGVGFVLLILPGVLLWALLVFTLPAVVIERKGGVAALKRSVTLGKGFYWRNLGVLLLAILVVVAFAMLIFMLAIGAGVAAGGTGEEFGFSLLSSLASILVTPLGQIPLILLYYDMRVRKEFFDGSALAQEMFA